MRVAVFGAGGQLGRALARVGDANVIGFDRTDADITNVDAVDKVLRKAHASVVVNAAAYTAVDKAESEEKLAVAVNVHGAGNVAAAAQAMGLPVIHISTDYVFDGTKQGAYVEDDFVAPLGAYGRSKALGEAAVRARCERAIILRTAWVFGLEGANFVKTMLRLGAERDVLRIVDDQHGNPTFADDLAEGVLKIAKQVSEALPAQVLAKAGTYHLAASGQATWFEFAGAIFARRPGPRLEPIPTSQYPTPARRPANSVLDCSKAKRTFAVELPPWNDGLSRMLDAHLRATRP